MKTDRDILGGILDSIDMGIYVVDDGYDIVYINRAIVDVLGEPRGRTCYGYFHDRDTPCPWCRRARVAAGMEFRNEIFYDRNSCYYNLTEIPLPLAAGRVLKLGVLQDITEMQAAREQLKRSESKLSSIFRTVPTGIGIVIDRVFQEVNDKFCEMVGYEREELLGRNARMVYPTEEEHDYVGREQQRQCRELGTGTIETRLRHKNGSIMNALLSMTPKDMDDLSAGITFSFTDITNMKRIETRLRQSENKFRSMMESMNDSVYICSQEYRIEYMNPAMIRKTGQDATGELCYRVLHGFDAPCSWCRMGRDDFHRTCEADFTSPRDRRSYHVSCSPIVNDDRTVSSIFVLRDTTELKKLEAQLFQDQKIKSMGTLAGGIAHDFNNILTAIIGYAELAKIHVQPDTKIRNAIDGITQAATRASELVRQILTFSRKGGQELIPLLPAPIVKEALKMMRSSLPSTVLIEEEIDSRCGYIKADPTQIHQVILNLCTNACQAMEAEKGTIRVRLYRDEQLAGVIGAARYGLGAPTTLTGPFVVLAVRDDGVGIAPEIFARIFEPYFTTKDVGRGTGLGLAVVDGIVSSHGGFLRVETEVGKGTDFQVYIPALVDASRAETEALPVGDECALLPGSGRILLVDDEQFIVDVFAGYLTAAGYEVQGTTDSLNALSLYREAPQSFDLLITDQTMPNLSGAELVRRIFELDPGFPVIVCTGYSAVITEQDALALGVKKYISKPVKPPQLVSAVRQVLDGG